MARVRRSGRIYSATRSQSWITDDRLVNFGRCGREECDLAIIGFNLDVILQILVRSWKNAGRVDTARHMPERCLLELPSSHRAPINRAYSKRFFGQHDNFEIQTNSRCDAGALGWQNNACRATVLHVWTAFRW